MLLATKLHVDFINKIKIKCVRINFIITKCMMSLTMKQPKTPQDYQVNSVLQYLDAWVKLWELRLPVMKREDE